MEQNAKEKYLIPSAIVIAGIFVAAAVYFGGSSQPRAANPDIAAASNINIAQVTDKDHIIGSRNADIVIVEYSDTECPFCKVFHNTMKEVVSAYDSKVAWVYRHFPIAQLHAKAEKEAEATECAAELGGNQAFWSYIDEVFERTNSNDSLDSAELPKIAGDIGLDVTAFNDCLSSGRHTEFVKSSVEEAVKAGARGTPYSVIINKDGKKAVINGAEPLDMIKVKVDALLK